MKNQQDKSNDVLITRVFSAPRNLVFAAFADTEHLKNWFAPDNCTLEILTYDFKTGGEFHQCIHNPQYGDCWVKGVFDEIIVPERIVYTSALCDKEGNYVEGPPVKDEEWPNETTVTLTFEELNRKTTLTLHQTAPLAAAKRTGAYQSWLQMLDKLVFELQ